ncbi:hypothetical protein LAZ67_20001926 [Cordylochernes scorpioides]|uniref:PiggyBac transposable element-derived protein domain-containing protein n=1 Tax=Cordylochernes scorpioides TaxID=51811 RepID=A0ABY6LP98_9ARAC|nr:hypothetical protein LAZ67_20001926 [Cordylochernes scorpioides]
MPSKRWSDCGAAHHPGVHITDCGAAHHPGVHITDCGAAHHPGVHITDCGAAHHPGVHITDCGAAHHPGVHITDCGAAHHPGDRVQQPHPPDDNILECIVTNTNIYIRNIQQNYSRERDANLTNLHEIKALLGNIYFLGVMKANKLNTDDAWARDSTGFELCRIAMSENRFRFLLRVIRFDDKATRNERLRQDKLAAVRLILDTFVKNCQKHYSPSKYITVDEKLDAFRGKWNFRQYIQSKHNKYGIKLFALVDSKMFYTCNLEIYSGKNPEAVSNSPSDVVERLCEPIKGTGRNVTMDNWFTSYSLALKLLQQLRLTIDGTLKRNKKEIPSEFVISRGRNVHTSVFGFQSEMILLSYKPKENKVVLMLSTLHHDANIDDSTGELKKPEMIMFYNMTKGGVDMMDEMTAIYEIIHFANGNASKVKSRRHFLKTSSLDLIEEMVKVRTVSGRMPCEIKEKASDIFNLLEPGPSKKPKIGERHRCKKCQKEKKDRKLFNIASTVLLFVRGREAPAEPGEGGAGHPRLQGEAGAEGTGGPGLPEEAAAAGAAALTSCLPSPPAVPSELFLSRRKYLLLNLGADSNLAV